MSRYGAANEHASVVAMLCSLVMRTEELDVTMTEHLAFLRLLYLLEL